MTERALWIFAAPSRRSITAVLRPDDSIRSTRAPGSAIASTSPGKPGPAPMSAIRLARARSVYLQAAQAVGHMEVARALGVADRRMRIRLGRERLQQQRVARVRFP